MPRMKFLAAFVLLGAPVFAAENGAAGAPAEEPSVLIWQAANFLILVAALFWLSKKYGGPLLAARSKEIKEGLAAGEKAKAEADARASEVKAKLANLDKEIAALRTAAKDERDRESERIRRDTQAEIARIHLQADHEMEAAGKQARLEVQRVAARIAIELAEHQVRARMSPQVQDALLKGFLSDLLRDGAFRTASNVD
jgi:F-type H+-transporting ATPase subunit b